MKIESSPTGAWPEPRPAGAAQESGLPGRKPAPDGQEPAPSVDGKGAPSSAPRTAATAPPSSTKSLTYGVLGIERPDHPEEPPNTAYETGEWIGAAGKIGAILSLLL